MQELQADRDNRLACCNNERPRRGYRNMGRSETIEEGKRLAPEEAA
jgi:hypothetical protein